MESSTFTAGQQLAAAELNAVRQDVLDLGGDFAISGGSANAYTLSIDAQTTALQTGATFKLKANHTNTGAATLNVNSIGATAIQYQGTALQGLEIIKDKIVTVIFDGTYFQIISGISIQSAKVILGSTGLSPNTYGGFLLNNDDKIVTYYSTRLLTIRNLGRDLHGGIDTDYTLSPAIEPYSHISRYIDTSEYLIGRKQSASSFVRTDIDGQNAVDMTISGDSPGAYTYTAWDFTNNHLWALGGPTSTTVKRYTISGTVLTQVSPDITLSVAPTLAQRTFFGNDKFYVLDRILISGNYYFGIRRYAINGTLEDTMQFSWSTFPYVISIVGTNEYWLSVFTRDNSYAEDARFYKINF